MQAIVLCRRDFREYDQMISFYTLEQGMTEAVARGVKKIVSKNSPHLEAGAFVHIETASAKEYPLLTTVFPMKYFVSIRADFEKSRMALRGLDMVRRLVSAGEADERIFFLLLDWLSFVDGTPVANPALLDSFLCKMMFLLGFGRCAAGDDALYDDCWERAHSLPVSASAHAAIFDFVRYHIERDVPDWGVGGRPSVSSAARGFESSSASFSSARLTLRRGSSEIRERKGLGQALGQIR